jgi:hypothetical protein
MHKYARNINYMSKIDQLMNDYMPLTPDVRWIFWAFLRRCEMVRGGVQNEQHDQVQCESARDEQHDQIGTWLNVDHVAQ